MSRSGGLISAWRRSSMATAHGSASTGQRFFPPKVANVSMPARTIEGLADFFRKEIEQGIDDTGIKAGVIKIGVAAKAPTTLEQAGLRAAVRAGRVFVAHEWMGETTGFRFEAIDAAGNAATSRAVTLSVSNAGSATIVDSTPPQLTINSPVNGARVSGNTVTVSTSASDNAGASGIRQTLYIDGQQVASGSGANLSYSWNVKKASSGAHTIQAVARDAAGNTTTTTSQVTK